MSSKSKISGPLLWQKFPWNCTSGNWECYHCVIVMKGKTGRAWLLWENLICRNWCGMDQSRPQKWPFYLFLKICTLDSAHVLHGNSKALNTAFLKHFARPVQARSVQNRSENRFLSFSWDWFTKCFAGRFCR